MTTRSVAPLLLLALALSGCAASSPTTVSTSEPSPTATSGPSSSPSPLPSEDPAASTTMVLTGEGFELTGAVDFAFAWPDDPTGAVDALTEAFGAEPQTAFQQGDGTHIADFDLYSWQGFELAAARLDDKPRDEYFLPSYVTVSAREPHATAIASAGGAAVGMTLDALATLDPFDLPEDYPSDFLIEAVDPSLLGSVEESTDGIGISVDEAGTVVRMRAPQTSYYAF